MKLLSEIICESKYRFMYHLTPSNNVPGILSSGLIAGVNRTTSGIETQKKIYLASRVTGLPNLFPNLFGYEFKQLNLLKVDVSGLEEHLEPDPEYPNDDCAWMCGISIPVERIFNLGRVELVKGDDGLDNYMLGEK